QDPLLEIRKEPHKSHDEGVEQPVAKGIRPQADHRVLLRHEYRQQKSQHVERRVDHGYSPENVPGHRAVGVEQPAQIEGKGYGYEKIEYQKIDLLQRVRAKEVRQEWTQGAPKLAQPDANAIAIPTAALANERGQGDGNVRPAPGLMSKAHEPAGALEPDRHIEVLARSDVIDAHLTQGCATECRKRSGGAGNHVERIHRALSRRNADHVLDSLQRRDKALVGISDC